MRRKIIPWLTVAFVLSLLFAFSLNASANAINEVDTDTKAAAIEQVTTLSDNEYSTLEEFTAAFAQAIYNRQERTVLRLRGAELSNADIARITNEILKHDPDNPKGGDYITYHMSGGYNYNFVVKEDENGVYTELVFECAYSADAQMEKEVDEAVEALLAELNLWEASDYRKIKGVYDWMADNITYDYDWDDGVLDDEHEHSVHAAIIDRVAVCDGISNLFYRLMLELDVDCRIITGGEADERHAWNIVKLNGVYYNVDATWDLGVSDYHRYFLCTESNFIGHDKDSFFESEEWLAKYPMATLPYVEHVAASGSVNANIHWVLDADTGTLTVSGRGAIPSYRYSYAPWYSYRNNIARIVIEEGITEVGERSFYWSVNCSEVILPSSLIAIRQYGFNNLQSLEGITLPENLKIIEFCAFSECTALKSIVLPDSVTTVGSSAFSNCKVLTSAVLSAGMKEVPDSMFFGDVKLESIVLPEGITRINDTVFSDCAFSEFTIPSTVTSIGVSAFSSCSKLTSITVDEKNTTYKSVDGVLFSKDGKHLICYPAAKKGSKYVMPEGTVVVDYGAFRGQSKLFTVSFPSTLVEIEGYAFSYCTYLDSLVFPKNLTTIGSDAFRSCKYLSLVTFENPDVNLVGYTFADCTSLRKIDLPANLKAIPHGLFFGCRALENIDIPKTVTSIGSSAFFDCDSLIDVVIPGNVKTIGQQAFDFCKFLDSITFEEGVATLDWIAIRNAPSLSTVVFPSTLKSIGRENFENCPYVRIYADCGSVGYNYAINNGIRYTASHNYVPIASYPSTCTKQGYTLYSCPCGKLDSYNDDYLPLLPHNYKAKVTAPTCTKQGYTTHTCSSCGTSYIDTYTDTLGHNFGDWYEVTAPDCTTKGSNHRDCSRCNYSETKSVDPLGHALLHHEAKTPTCTDNGWEAYDTCSRCDYSTKVELSAIGHNAGDWIIDTEPTCENNGSKHKECTVCHIVLEESVIPMLNHSYISVVAKPTCTESGYTTRTCHCGDSYVDNYVSALGHTSSEVIVENSVAPTCTTSGSCDNVIYCTECGEELSREKETIDPLGHSFGDWCEVTVPTCTDEGIERRDCARCDAFETNIVSALGHSYNAVITPPTCTESGYTTYTCHCGDSYIGTYVDALGHTPGEAVMENVVEPTCTAFGTCENVIYCTKCRAELDRERIIIAPLGHAPSEIVVENSIDATCIAAGSCDNVIYCTECKAELSRERITVNPLGHSYGDWYEVTTPTCTDEGLERRDCIRCDAFETNVVSELGHTYATSITAPTCTERGYTTYTCHCGDSYVDNYVDALGHAPSDVVAENIVEPTCTAEGSCDNVVYCEICEIEIDREAVVIEATGHSYKAWVQIVAPSCESGGVERRECINCKKYETRDIAALGHEWIEDDYYRVCTFCGEIIELETDHSECETSLFETIINLIINFFRILFGLPEICVCGEELN